MSVKIIYNEKDAFYPFPTPFIGLSVENLYYGELWAKRDNITIEGQITGCTFDKIYSGYKFIQSNFAKNYQPLEIWEEEGGISGKIFESRVAEISSFSVQNSRWVGVLPYTITIDCYPSGFFSGNYGILEPSEIWSTQEGNDYKGTISHSISCRGINTSNEVSNALDNAKNWALSKTGTVNYITPILIENVSQNRLQLLTVEERIDRFNGTYSITENYSTDLTRTGYGVLRYSATVESGNNLITVNLNGTAEGNQQNITGTRAAFNYLDKYGAALLGFQQVFDRSDLNPIPLSYTVNEDPYESKISFNYLFNNDSSPEIVFDYKVSVNSGQIITANINGTIIARGGDVKSKLDRALAYSSGVDLYSLTQNFYNSFYPNFSSSPLNSIPISSGISINEFQGVVGLNADFSNNINPDGFVVFNYTIGITPQLQKIDSKGVVNGEGIYSTVDLGYTNRAELTIDGDCIMLDSTDADDGLILIQNQSISLFTKFGTVNNAILEKNDVIFNRYDKKIASFSFVWSFDSLNQVIFPPNYDTVNTFQIK